MTAIRLEKYIEERFPRYFVFGGSGDRVDVASTQNDTIATVTPAQAAMLIADREAVVDALLKLAHAANGTEALDEVLGYR